VSAIASLISTAERCYVEEKVSMMVNVSGSARENGRQGGRTVECAIEIPCLVEGRNSEVRTVQSLSLLIRLLNFSTMSPRHATASPQLIRYASNDLSPVLNRPKESS
jgi:hypothetical protein